MKQISNLAILFLAILPIGCMQKSKTNVNSAVANVPNGKTFAPPISDSNSLYKTLTDLHESGTEYKGYSWSNSRPEVKAKTLSAVVSDSMTVWANPTPDGTFMAGFPVSQDERNKDMQIISLSTINYLRKQFQVSAAARYKILVLIYQGSTAVVYNNNDPSALYIHLLLLDTNTKLILWHADTPTTMGYYSDIDYKHNGIVVAAKVAAKLINQQLDILFDEPDSTSDSTSAGYYNRASAKDDLGRHAEAIALYTKAITLNPKDKYSYDGRGYAKIGLRHYADAIADFDKAITLDGKYDYAYNERGYAYYKLGKTKSNYRKAIADYDMAVKFGDGHNIPPFHYRDSAVAAMSKAVGP